MRDWVHRFRLRQGRARPRSLGPSLADLDRLGQTDSTVDAAASRNYSLSRAGARRSGVRAPAARGDAAAQIPQAHWPGFRAAIEIDGGELPALGCDEFQAYIRSGILAHGFLRVRCKGCGQSRAVAFSRKRRDFSPSCLGRRIADIAASTWTVSRDSCAPIREACKECRDDWFPGIRDGAASGGGARR